MTFLFALVHSFPSAEAGPASEPAAAAGTYIKLFKFYHFMGSNRISLRER